MAGHCGAPRTPRDVSASHVPAASGRPSSTVEFSNVVLMKKPAAVPAAPCGLAPKSSHMELFKIVLAYAKRGNITHHSAAFRAMYSEEHEQRFGRRFYLSTNAVTQASAHFFCILFQTFPSFLTCAVSQFEPLGSASDSAPGVNPAGGVLTSLLGCCLLPYCNRPACAVV